MVILAFHYVLLMELCVNMLKSIMIVSQPIVGRSFITHPGVTPGLYCGKLINYFCPKHIELASVSSVAALPINTSQVFMRFLTNYSLVVHVIAGMSSIAR